MSLIKKGRKNRLKGKLQQEEHCMSDTATNGREYTGPVRRVVPRDLSLMFSREWSQRRASALPYCLRAMRLRKEPACIRHQLQLKTHRKRIYSC